MIFTGREPTASGGYINYLECESGEHTLVVGDALLQQKLKAPCDQCERSKR